MSGEPWRMTDEPWRLIGRLHKSLSGDDVVAVDTDKDNSDEIDFRGFAGGVFHVASGSITSLTVYVAFESGGTYYPLYDSDGAPVTISPVSGGAKALPTELYDVPFVKFQGNAAGTIDLALKG